MTSNPDRSSPEYRRRVDAVMSDISKAIDKYGWQLTGVFPTHGSDMVTYLCYTTGLLERGHPELLTLGMRPESAHSLINQLYDEYIIQNYVFQDGEEMSGVANLPIRFRDAPSNHPIYNCGTGQRLYQIESFPVLQIVFPDKKGIWPWEPGCDKEIIITQQLLMPEVITAP